MNEQTTIVELQKLCADKTIIDAHFTARNSGGYSANLLGYQAFMPGSQSLVPSSTLVEEDDLIGATAPVIIIEVQLTPLKVIISRREVDDMEYKRVGEQRLAKKNARSEAAEAKIADLLAIRAEEIKLVQVGDIVEATAHFNKPTNAFFELGNLLICVPQGELAWGEADMPTKGTMVKCEITGINLEKLLLYGSVKSTMPSPWLTAQDRYHPGQTLNVTVKNLLNFGVFVELEPGVEGLLHRSCIPGIPAEAALSDYFSRGDSLPLVIESMDVKNRRISLQPLPNFQP